MTRRQADIVERTTVDLISARNRIDRIDRSPRIVGYGNRADITVVRRQLARRRSAFPRCPTPGHLRRLVLSTNYGKGGADHPCKFTPQDSGNRRFRIERQLAKEIIRIVVARALSSADSRGDSIRLCKVPDDVLIVIHLHPGADDRVRPGNSGFICGLWRRTPIQTENTESLSRCLFRPFRTHHAPVPGLKGHRAVTALAEDSFDAPVSSEYFRKK